MSSICINALKGDINEFREVELGLSLCQYAALSSVCTHELIANGLLQYLVDLMLKTQCTQFWLKILNTVDVLIEQEEFLRAMQNEVLVIKIKPEVIYVEEKISEPKRFRERSKEKHRRDSKDRKSRRAKNRRSKSRSKEKRVEKKRGVIENSLGELVETDQQIQTLYQLLLSLLLPKQNSSIIKKLRLIIKKITFIEKLKELNKEQKRATIVLNLENIYEYLQENTVMTNELGQLLNRYSFIQVLLNMLVTLLLMNRIKMGI